MINKENKNLQPTAPSGPDDNDLSDVAKMDVQCHLLIKDRDTDETILNKRG